MKLKRKKQVLEVAQPVHHLLESEKTNLASELNTLQARMEELKMGLGVLDSLQKLPTPMLVGMYALVKKGDTLVRTKMEGLDHPLMVGQIQQHVLEMVQRGGTDGISTGDLLARSRKGKNTWNLSGALQGLRKKGLVRCEGRSRDAVWRVS